MHILENIKGVKSVILALILGNQYKRVFNATFTEESNKKYRINKIETRNSIKKINEILNWLFEKTN